MTILLDGQKFYTTAEACKLAGTNRDTLLRWIREKKFNDVKYRDRNGWRLFTEEDVIRLKKRVNRIIDVNVSLEKTR